jgi:hypothetical protein
MNLFHHDACPFVLVNCARGVPQAS